MSTLVIRMLIFTVDMVKEQEFGGINMATNEVAGLLNLLDNEDKGEVQRHLLELKIPISSNTDLMKAAENKRSEIYCPALILIGFSGDTNMLPALKKLASKSRGERSEYAVFAIAMIAKESEVLYYADIVGRAGKNIDAGMTALYTYDKSGLGVASVRSFARKFLNDYKKYARRLGYGGDLRVIEYLKLHGDNNSDKLLIRELEKARIRNEGTLMQKIRLLFN